MHNLFLTKMQKKFKREMKAFFKNDAGANGHPQAKKNYKQKTDQWLPVIRDSERKGHRRR